MDKIKLLKELLQTIEEDAVKFYDKENNAAGTRLRNSLQQVKQLSQELRNEVQDVKTNRKDTK